jgi:hypothetical protein
MYFFEFTQPLAYFSKLTQPATYFYSSVTVHSKGEWRKTERKPYHLPYALCNPYPMSENSQDYAQKPQRNCTFMNSAFVLNKYNKIKQWAPKQVKKLTGAGQAHSSPTTV